MKKDRPNTDKPEDLRRKAEAQLRKKKAKKIQKMSDAEVRALAHELQVHQIELEMQNEELKRARAEAEDALNRYTNLYDFAPVGYFTFDGNGTILEANLAGAKLLGIERDSLVKRQFQLFIEPDSRAGFNSFCKRISETDVKQTCELLLKNNKSPMYVAIEGVAVHDAGGSGKQIRAAIVDVTDRKQSEEQLRLANGELRQRTMDLSLSDETLRSLRAILDNMGDGLVVADIQGKLTYINPTAEKILGKGLRKVTAYKWSEQYRFYWPDMATPYQADDLPLSRAIRGESVDVAEVFVQQVKEPVSVWISITARPLIDENGSLKGGVAVFRDVTRQKRTEEKLNVLSQVVEQSPASVVVVDTKGAIGYVNKKFTTITEYAVDEVVGKNPRVLKSDETPMEEYKRLWDTITSGGVWRGEFHNRKKSGELYWEHAVISPVRNAEGSITHFVGIKEDISERKQAERRLCAQHTVMQILAEAAGIADASLKILQTICECLAWDIGALWAVDTESNVLRLVEYWHVPSVKAPEFEAVSRKITFSPGVGLPGRVWADGKPFWITDVTEDANFPRIAIAAKEGLHGAFCFPIMIKEEILGVMEFFSCKTRQPDNDLLNMMSAVGRQIGLFVKHRQADEISKRTALEYKTVLGTTMDGFWVADTKGRLLDVNDAAYHLTGYSRKELLTMRIQDIEDKETPKETAQHIRQIMNAGYDRFETRHRRKDGKIVDIEVSVNYVKIAGGRFFAFLRDITERKKSEAQIRLQLQRLAVISNIDKVILSTLDLRVVLEVFLDKAFPQLHVDAADILLFNPYMQTLEYAAGCGFHTSAIQRTRVRLGEGCCGRAAVERHPVFIHNLPEESCVRSKQLSTEESFVSCYVAPIIAKGQVNGVLEVFHRAPFEPDQEWLGFLEMLAGQAAIAIDNVGLFESLQHANTELVQAYDSTIVGWSHALDLRDKETEGHSQRVTDMALQIAIAMGINKEHLVHVRRGALLHDIGKMGVPDSILLKVEPLTDGDWVIMRKHPVYAYELLSRIAYLCPALDIPYCHHEKWDGTGYPRGLKGEEIPLAARIFAVVDVWDALRSDRPYRKGWAEERVREYIKSLAGTHFDPQVTETFLEMKW